MKTNFCVLFDMDGVVIDTEPQYDLIWRSISAKYLPEEKDFEKKIKGTILPNILSQHFSHLPEEHQVIIDTISEYELQMDFFEIPGAISFIRSLKEQGIKTGLVTSSGEEKVALVAEKMNFDELFDTIVSAGRITEGKPNPMCYLLAAQDLGFSPSDCYVFEDSFAGIQSGNDAGMKVIGLSTTNSAESLQDKVIKVIPDFLNFSMSEVVK